MLEHGRLVEQGTHDELMARSALYRTLLSGLEEEEAEKIGDRIEALATMAADGDVARDHRLRLAASTAGRSCRAGGPHRRGARASGRAWVAVAAGGAVGVAGDSTWRRPPSCWPGWPPCARCATSPRSTWSESRATTRGFSLGRLLSEFRRPLLVGLVLVVIDALATLAGPILVKTGIDSGVSAGSEAVLFAASAVFLVVTLVDLVDEIGETFVTGRAAQRIMLSLRIRIWAQLQRLSLDYYEREMAGRIMTRMTTDVDQFESLIENGLLSALVSLVTFVGVGVALVVINPELGLCTLIGRRAAGRGHRDLPAEGRPPLRPVPRADRHRQRRLPGEPLGRAGVPGLRARGRDHQRRFHRSADSTSSRGWPPSGWWPSTSPSSSSSRGWPTPSCSASAPA